MKFLMLLFQVPGYSYGFDALPVPGNKIKLNVFGVGKLANKPFIYVS